MTRRNRRRLNPEERSARRSWRLRTLVWGPLRLLGLACIGVALGVGAFALERFLRSSPALTIRVLEVRGVGMTRPESLLRAAGLQEGQNIFSVDEVAAARRIRNHPWIRYARVHRVVPDRIVVEVEEFQAAALVNLDGFYFLDSSGEIFKRWQAGEPADLPVISGVSREMVQQDPLRAQERLREALLTIHHLEGQACLTGLRVAEIHHDELLGISAVLDPGARVVHLGPPPVAERLPRLCQVLAQLKKMRAEADEIRLVRAGRSEWIGVQLAAVAIGDAGTNKNLELRTR